MNKVRWFIAASLLNVSFGYTFDEVQKNLSASGAIEAHFTQERIIKGMPKPLQSQGKMSVSKTAGLKWYQETPFKLTLLLTDKMISQELANGEKEVITAGKNPQLFQFNKLLLSLFNMDTAALNESFIVEFNGDQPNKWQIFLVPKVAPLNKIFKNIQLEGGQFLNTVDIYDLEGDRTQIQFSKQRRQ